MQSTNSSKKRYPGFDDQHIVERYAREQILKILRDASEIMEQTWLPQEPWSDEVVAEMNKKIDKVLGKDKDEQHQ
jgi:hypothetical protein